MAHSSAAPDRRRILPAMEQHCAPRTLRRRLVLLAAALVLPLSLATVPIGKPEDVAAAVKFLASEEAGYITGAVLNVNGGMYM